MQENHSDEDTDDDTRDDLEDDTGGNKSDDSVWWTV